MRALDLRQLYRAAAVALYRTAAADDRTAGTCQETGDVVDAAAHRQRAAEARHQAATFEALNLEASHG